MNKKDLNSKYSNQKGMKRGIWSFKEQRFIKAVKEAQKDPNFIKELNKFIKTSTNIYHLEN